MTLQDIIGRFPGIRVLVVGDLVLDEYVTGECTRLSPEAPVPVVNVASSRSVLGGAGNTAANVTALGASAILVAPLANDHTGRTVRDLAARHRIDLVAIDDARPTPRKIRVLGSRQQLLRLDYEDRQPSSTLVTSAALTAVEQHASACSVVVVSDYAKGFLSKALADRVVSAARTANVPVVIDPRPENEGLYAGADYLTPNWKEAQAMAGRANVEPNATSITEIGRTLALKYEANILLTLGAHGMRFFPRDGGESFEEPAQAREVFDVSGAGDTVVASLALALAAGADIRTAVRLANLAAGVVVGRLGTATVAADDIVRDDRNERRLIRREELAGLAKDLRASGKRIVTINGSFDVLHAGHLHILREARRQGDVLIVGVNSDASVAKNKGAGRPFVSQEDRARLLLGLRDVDFVHIFDETVPMPFLDEVGPDVHVNGAEYGESCIEAETIRRRGGRLHLVERLPGLSTSDLAAKIARGTTTQS